MVRKLRVGGSQTRFDGSQTQRRFANFAWQVRLGKGSSMAMCWLHSLHNPPIMPTGKAIVCMDIEEGKSMFEPFQISRRSKKEQFVGTCSNFPYHCKSRAGISAAKLTQVSQIL